MRFVFLTAYLGAGLFAPSSQAQQSVSGAARPASPPWQKDLVKTVAPQYPYWDRYAWHQGNGLFLLDLDFKTGAVTSVAVKRSTGFRSLDQSAVFALRQWRFKPGKWKKIEVPVHFEMAWSRADAMQRIKRLQEGNH